MDKVLKPNPYNVFGVRRASVPPAHFEYINVPLNYNMSDALEKWIETHLKRRYFISKTVSIDGDNKMAYTVRIGFEDSKELSYFMLACPHLKYK